MLLVYDYYARNVLILILALKYLEIILLWFHLLFLLKQEFQSSCIRVICVCVVTVFQTGYCGEFIACTIVDRKVCYTPVFSLPAFQWQIQDDAWLSDISFMSTKSVFEIFCSDF